MRKKINDALLFAVVGIALTAFLCFANKMLIIKALYAPENLKLDSHIQTLFCGASLAVFAFNPAVIPDSLNIALPAENFFYTYYKLKKILQSNSQINTVVLTYSFGSLSKKQDEDFIDPKKTPEYYNRYFVLLDKEGRSVIQRLDRRYIYALIQWHLGFPLELHRSFRLFFKKIFSPLHVTEYPFLGGFQEEDIEQLEFFKFFKTDKEKAINWALSRHYPTDKETFGTSSIMVAYLKKITRLCRDKSIRLILVVTPLQDDYFTRIPAYYKNLNATTFKELKVINPNLKFYDYSHFFNQDKYFLDCDHLNRIGANIFSDMIYENVLRQSPLSK